MKSTKRFTLPKPAFSATWCGRERTRFSKEFAFQAVELLEPGRKNPTELAMEPGIRQNALYKWRELRTVRYRSLI